MQSPFFRRPFRSRSFFAAIRIGVLIAVILGGSFSFPVPTDAITTVTSFDNTFSSASNIVYQTTNEITASSGVTSGTLDSQILDTQATNGVGYNTIGWNGSMGAGATLNNYTYNSKLGLIGMNCALMGTGPPNCSTTGNWKVTVDGNGVYHGWAWSDVYGWISFNCEEPGTCGSVSYSVTESTGAYPRRLSGWAWSEAVGWIAMACDSVVPNVCGVNWDTATTGGVGTKNSVWVDASGNYHGWAWTNTIGWISFDCNQTATAPYNCASNTYQVTRTAGSGGKVQLWLATSNAPAGPWNFRGRDCVIDGLQYEPSVGTPTAIGCVSDHWNKRYFRYRVKICTAADCVAIGSVSPVVDQITVNWAK